MPLILGQSRLKYFVAIVAGKARSTCYHFTYNLSEYCWRWWSKGIDCSDTNGVIPIITKGGGAERGGALIIHTNTTASGNLSLIHYHSRNISQFHSISQISTFIWLEKKVSWAIIMWDWVCIQNQLTSSSHCTITSFSSDNWLYNYRHHSINDWSWGNWNNIISTTMLSMMCRECM